MSGNRWQRGQGQRRDRWGQDYQTERARMTGRDYDYGDDDYDYADEEFGQQRRRDERYGDERDASFERGRTSRPGSIGGRTGGESNYNWDRGYSGEQANSYPYGDEGARWPGERRGQYTGRGPKGYRRSDERIMEDVCEILTRHGDIDASDITVRVENGEVTLEGTVERRELKRMVEDAIEGVTGVKDIHNRLRVHQGQLGDVVEGSPGQTTTSIDPNPINTSRPPGSR